MGWGACSADSRFFLSRVAACFFSLSRELLRMLVLASQKWTLCFLGFEFHLTRDCTWILIAVILGMRRKKVQYTIVVHAPINFLTLALGLIHRDDTDVQPIILMPDYALYSTTIPSNIAQL